MHSALATTADEAWPRLAGGGAARDRRVGEIPPPPIGALMATGAGSGRVESVRRVLA
jgi:hypothetical protein